jgi:hypothetical protein
MKMNTPHKHAEVIKAWADGIPVETCIGGDWTQVINPCPYWSTQYEYRIKPIPHIHQALMDAHAKGAVIEHLGLMSWVEIKNPSWETYSDYRVKPAHHKHQVFMDAFAAGKPVQFMSKFGTQQWVTMTTAAWSPSWCTDYEYRIKPEVVKYRLVLVKMFGTTYEVYALSDGEDYSGEFIRWLSDWQEVEV